MSALSSRAIDLCRSGFSPSEATAMAIMQLGCHVSPGAVQRIESLCAADLVRHNAPKRGPGPRLLAARFPIHGGRR